MFFIVSVATTAALSRRCAPPEVTLQGDGHGQVAQSMRRLVAADPDDADGGLAVAVGAEFDHRCLRRTASHGRSHGDVDDRIEGPVQLGIAVGVERGGHPGEQRLARPARDEHAVAEPEPRLVGVVEAFELGGDVDRRAMPAPGRTPVRDS